MRQQLPALLLWLASADGDDQSGDTTPPAHARGAHLTPEHLAELSCSLTAPTASLAVLAQHLQAQQALQGQPVTAEQVRQLVALGLPWLQSTEPS